MRTWEFDDWYQLRQTKNELQIYKLGHCVWKEMSTKDISTYADASKYFNSRINKIKYFTER